MKKDNTKTPKKGRVQFYASIAMLLTSFVFASQFVPFPAREIPLTATQHLAAFLANSCLWAAWFLAGRRHAEKEAGDE